MDDLERCGHLGPGRRDGRPERLTVLPQQHEDRDQGSDRRHDKADGGQQERDRRTDALNRGHQASNRGNDRAEHLHANERGHQQVHKLGRLRKLVDHRNQELVNELRNIRGDLLDRARKARPHRRHKRPQSIQETHQDRQVLERGPQDLTDSLSDTPTQSEDRGQHVTDLRGTVCERL